MKIDLTYKNELVGEIYPHVGSFKTNELKGLVIPTNYFFELRSSIVEYNEIFGTKQSKINPDDKANTLISKNNRDIRDFYSHFEIRVDKKIVSNEQSEIRIIDNMEKTGLGNPVLSIDAWRLETRSISQELLIYKIEYRYPSNPRHIIEISKNGKLIREY